MASPAAPAYAAPLVPAALDHLRSHAMTCVAAGLLPLPLVAAGDPATSADVACVYLALASAWLATEIVRAGERPTSLAAWRARQLAIALAVAANTAVFVVMGLAAGVKTNLPFPMLAAGSALAAVGLIPALARRVRQPYAAIVLAGLMALAAKLIGCVAARIVYGPQFIEAGYVAGDWNTAKLMITIFWGLTTALALCGLADGPRRS
jgi:hypothetical protein